MKLYIFDLDSVISLTNILPFKILEYETRLHKWLTNISNNGSILVLLTHNLNPNDVLKGLSKDFRSLFTEIFSPESADKRTPKDVTVRHILQKYNIPPSQAIFYDDYVINVESVKQIKGMTCVLVDPNVGIQFI